MTTTPERVLGGATHDLAALPEAVLGRIDATDHLYASRPWLAVEEQVAGVPPFYVWSAGGGFAAAYHFDERSNPWPIARLDLFLEAAGRPSADVLPCYLLGGRRPGHSRFPVADGPGRLGELTSLVGKAAEAAADLGAATIAALYCDDSDEELAEAFRAHGGVRVPSHATYRLELPGPSYEDWLRSLPRKQRTKELADQRKLGDANVTYDVRPLTEADVDWIVPLEMGLYHKYGNDYRTGEAAGLHRAYLSCLGPDALLVEARRDGERVGFASVVRHGTSAFVRQAGFDDAATAGAPVYFGAVFHTVVRWACSAGVRSIDLSISAGQVKRRRGAVELPRSAWVVPLTAAARRTLA
ncbi:hypothetical protein SAMN05216553_105384 [Lentzea fradiae]|uniref:BioF2-like acetyltransferase domain-containing protein n=1 Tax=Lentzea fradiae TaxID=200378 RepID=A0A1G7RK51_9PSEU|nr:GNAT family N-acetyltransferase [Lentzea fradiae]SDG11146.1 hypothetical protein SAMN05216553_105384 [Lentzea fradiae]